MGRTKNIQMVIREVTEQREANRQPLDNHLQTLHLREFNKVLMFKQPTK